MAKIYVKWLKSGRITLDDVPPRWRKEVEKMIKE